MVAPEGFADVGAKDIDKVGESRLWEGFVLVGLVCGGEDELDVLNAFAGEIEFEGKAFGGQLDGGGGLLP